MRGECVTATEWIFVEDGCSPINGCAYSSQKTSKTAKCQPSSAPQGTGECAASEASSDSQATSLSSREHMARGYNGGFEPGSRRSPGIDVQDTDVANPTRMAQTAQMLMSSASVRRNSTGFVEDRKLGQPAHAGLRLRRQRTRRMWKNPRIHPAVAMFQRPPGGAR